MLNDKWKALLIGFTIRFSYLFSMQAIPPILPMMIGEFGLSFTVASSLMWLVALPGLLVSVLGGLLAGKYGVRKLVVFGMGISTASSLLCVFATDFIYVQLGRLLLGIGGALAVVAASSLLFQWFEREKLGMAMGVFSFCMPSATVIAFNMLGVVASGLGWRSAILITVTVNLGAFVVGGLLIQEKKSVSLGRITFAPFRNASIWILGLSWALFNMGILAYTTWGKTIFVRYDGLPMVFSDLLASIIMLGGFAQPLTGFISDRLGKRRPLIIIPSALASAVFIIFLYAQRTYMIPLAIALGLLAAFVPPATYALPEEFLGSGRGGVGFGVLNMFLNLGIILGPLAVGVILDATDSRFFSFVTMAVFTLGTAVFALFLKSK